jgi:hypothetical protein
MHQYRINLPLHLFLRAFDVFALHSLNSCKALSEFVVLEGLSVEGCALSTVEYDSGDWL